MNLELNAEQQLIKDTAREFAMRELEPHAEEWDEGHRFPRDMFNKMAELGFAGMLVPEEYGGVGADTLSYIVMLEEINRGGTTVIMVTHDAELARRAHRNVHVMDGKVTDFQPYEARPVVAATEERAALG